MSIEIEQITSAVYPVVAVLVGELLEEIMVAIDTRTFNFHLEEATMCIAHFVENGRYRIFVARDTATEARVGCLTMH